MKKRPTQSLHFWSNFDHPFPPEDGRNRKREAEVRKNVRYWAIQICQNQGSISSPGKTRLLFAIFGLFLEFFQNLTKFFKHVKTFQFQHFPVLQKKWTFQKKLNWIFKFGCFSWYHAHFSKKGELDYLMQNLMLNRLAPIPNPKNEKAKSLYALS